MENISERETEHVKILNSMATGQISGFENLKMSDVGLYHRKEDFGRMNVEVVPYVYHIVIHGSIKAVSRLAECFPNLLKRCQLLFDGHYRLMTETRVDYDSALDSARTIKRRLRA